LGQSHLLLQRSRDQLVVIALTVRQHQQRLHHLRYSFTLKITKTYRGVVLQLYLQYPRVQIMGQVPMVLMGRQVSCLNRAYSGNLLSRNLRWRVALLL
jgi:hypothetical protein